MFSSQDGQTALDIASLDNHTDVVKVLLDSGVQPDIKYFVSTYVIHIVASYPGSI